MTFGKPDTWPTRTPALSPTSVRVGPLARGLASARTAPALAVGMGLAFFSAWTWLVLAEQYTYNHFHRDIAIYVNLLWHTAEGRPFETTLLTRNDNHLAEHVVALLMPLSVLYRALPSPAVLLILQQAAISLAGAPIYRLARARFSSPWPALVVLLSFYLAPAVTEVAWDYVHAVAFAMVPLGFGAYYLLTGRTRLGAILASSTLLVDEASALALFGLGVMLLLRREVRVGALLTAIASAWLVLVTLIVMPAFHLEETLPEGGNRTLHKFAELRDDPAQALALLQERGPDGLRWFLLPNGGLPLLAPQALVAGLPTALAMVFADDPLYLRSNRTAPALPLLWIAAVEGLLLLRGGWRLNAGLAVLLAGSVVAFGFDSRLPGGGTHDPSLVRWTSASDAMRRVVAAVPPDANLVVTQNAAAFLAERENVKIFPFKYAHELGPNPRNVDWWVLDVTRQPIREEALADRDSPLLDESRPPALWIVEDAVIVATKEPPMPTHPAAGAFGTAVQLEAYDVTTVPEGARVRLAWRVGLPPPADYARRLELLDAEGRVAAAQVGPATRTYHGPSRWHPDQVVVEEVTLRLDPSRVAGGRLRLAWLDGEAGALIPLADGSSFLELEIPAPPR